MRMWLEHNVILISMILSTHITHGIQVNACCMWFNKQYKSSFSSASTYTSVPYRRHRHICCLAAVLPQVPRYSNRLWQGLFSPCLQGSYSCVVEVKLALAGRLQSEAYSASNPHLLCNILFMSSISLYLCLFTTPRDRPKDDSDCWWALQLLPPSAPCWQNGPSSSRCPITCDSMRTADLRRKLFVV